MTSKRIVNLKAYRGKVSNSMAKCSLAKFQREMSEDESYKQFEFLRSLGPYVFEDMILERVRQLGCVPWINWNYSGDGGLDGSFTHKDKRFNVQSKRYSSYINHAHVARFVEICGKWDTPGLFFHTGNTDKKSVWTCRDKPLFQMVSGQSLVDFLLDDKCEFFFRFLARQSGFAS